MKSSIWARPNEMETSLGALLLLKGEFLHFWKTFNKYLQWNAKKHIELNMTFELNILHTL